MVPYIPPKVAYSPLEGFGGKKRCFPLSVAASSPKRYPGSHVKQCFLLSSEIRRFIYGESGQIISVDTWVNAVFDAFGKYRDPARRQEAIDVLITVWMGRFSSFVRQTRFMDTRDAECMIRGQVDVFNEKKEDFLKNF